MDSIFGVHESALLLRARRMDTLATNLANADTPRYKARDLDFASALDAAGKGAAGKGAAVRVTHERHLPVGGAPAHASVKYRVPHQPAVDGNTVETDLELSRFAENAIAYQTSLMF